MSPSRALMIQGTGSDVGKSVLVAGIARALVRRGLRVRPFKPQNMSNNAAVTADGGEIGRAQALQARACGVAPSVDMNPVLLKPQSEIGAQVVVRGKVLTNADARAYQSLKPSLLPKVLESFAHLRREADIVLVEGAGSAAEINLRAADIANMGFALAAKVPVVLAGDIDRGGVIASLVGTHAVLEPAERALVRGFIINKFRGDASLFAEGLSAITARTDWPSFGVVPWLPEIARLPAEDAMALGRAHVNRSGGAVHIAVPMLSRIANFDDFDPLAQEPGVTLTMVEPGRPLPAGLDLIILPGTKATLADLKFLRAQGWDIDLLAHWRRGGAVWGICGGYQMLGRRIEDPDGVEGPPGGADGLGLLDVTTLLTGEKMLEEVAGSDLDSGAPVFGYEMHMGRTEGPGRVRPMLRLADGRTDGSRSTCGRVRGCYLHGLFRSDAFRASLLHGFGAAASGLAFEAGVEAALDALADHLERHLDITALLTAAA
ncbi:MAG: cobyric acid synthase [Rhodospirillaceae bacterium]